LRPATGFGRARPSALGRPALVGLRKKKVAAMAVAEAAEARL
jgi:hypothetical protein